MACGGGAGVYDPTGGGAGKLRRNRADFGRTDHADHGNACLGGADGADDRHNEFVRCAQQHGYNDLRRPGGHSNGAKPERVTRSILDGSGGRCLLGVFDADWSQE